jgi:hypothetical protein
MSVRFPYKGVQLPPTSPLYPYWGATGFSRSRIDIFVVGPSGVYVNRSAQIASAADWVVFEDRVALQLGLQPPFSRVVGVSGIAGAAQTHFTQPPDGTVSLFLTDYREYYFLPTLPVGFWPASPPGQPSRRNVLGITGFLQYFQVIFHHQLSRPDVELIDIPTFPGKHDVFSAREPLRDLLRRLKLGI